MNKALIKRILKIGLKLSIVWAVFFTAFGVVVADLVVHGMYGLATISVEDPPDFRTYVRNSTVLSSLCNATNWVADRTMPLVSDDDVIALWNEKHVQWEEMFRNAKPGRTDFEQTDPALSRSSGIAAISISDARFFPEGTDLSDYSVDVQLRSSIGRQKSIRACRGKGGRISKSIGYRLQPGWIVIMDGYLTTKRRLAEYDRLTKRSGAGRDFPGYKIVTNTDQAPNDRVVVRLINEQWVIKRDLLWDL